MLKKEVNVRRIWLIAVIVISTARVLPTIHAAPATEPATIDLTRWVPPEISSDEDDPFGKIVKYGYALFTNTARVIGPTAPDATMRFSGNNLACRNCHLKGGTQ